LVTLPKNFWTRVLGPVVNQLYAGECTPSVDRALGNFIDPLHFFVETAMKTFQLWLRDMKVCHVIVKYEAN